jgi:hypothetical protein
MSDYSISMIPGPDLAHQLAYLVVASIATPRYNTAPVRMATPTTSSATPSSVTATMW